MMRYPGILVAILLTFAVTPAALGAFAPSFHLEHSAWEATHVVVVTEGKKIDGVVEVLESWKGDLKKGDSFTLTELAAFAPAEARVVAKPLFGKDDGPTIRVTCSRMVLFLKQKPKSRRPEASTNHVEPAGGAGAA